MLKLKLLQVREANIDVVGFQEVREWNNGSQLAQLQELLPQFRFSAFIATENKVGQDSTATTGEEVRGADELVMIAFPAGCQSYREGLGMLSRFPLDNIEHIGLTQSQTQWDKNLRIVLSARVLIPGLEPLTFLVTHLSWEKPSQCLNTLELKRRADQFAPPVVIAGDFNVYEGYEWPMQPFFAAGEDITPDNPCKRALLGACALLQLSCRRICSGVRRCFARRRRALAQGRCVRRRLAGLQEQRCCTLLLCICASTDLLVHRFVQRGITARVSRFPTCLRPAW